MLSAIGLFCLIATTAWTHGEKIHMRMTKREVSAIFGQPHHDLVPEYDVVRLNFPTRHRRSVGTPQKLTYRALGDEVGVYLWPGNSVLATKTTPVYEAFTVNNNRQFAIIPDAMKNAGDLWEDAASGTSLVVKRDTRGKYAMDGYIGSHNMVVRSLPDAISDHLEQKSQDSHFSNHSAYHVVYRRAANQDQLRNARLSNRNLQGQYENKVLYPELMVVVDFYSYLAHNRDISRILAYVVAFWNSVDILYRQFEHPQIRIRIASVTIARDLKALSYMYESQVPQNGEDKINDYDVLDKAKHFYYAAGSMFPFDSYDGIVIMTGQNFSTTNIGLAFLGGLCKYEDSTESVSSIAITRDDGMFTYLTTAAHELGHLFNMSHDGEGNNCDPLGDYLMANGLKQSERILHFSDCSVKAFADFIDGPNLKCTENPPSLAGAIHRFLPAEFISRDQQCERAIPNSKSCTPKHAGYNPCLMAYCQGPKSGCEQTRVTVLDGSKCGEGKVCAHGLCLKGHLPAGKVKSQS